MHESDDLTPLTLIGRTRDGERLILTDEFGNHFSIDINDQVRTTVNAPILKLTTRGAVEYADDADAPLTPKLIQQRIRFGESVEEIAASAGVSPDSIERFAGPVLLERSHIAEQARETPMRKGGTQDHTLGAIVGERLAQRGITTIDWDAWKREDGRWNVAATYPSQEGASTAIWILDLARRALTTENDTARWLTGDDRSPSEKVAVPATGIIPSQPVTSHLRPVNDTLPLEDETARTAGRENSGRRATIPAWDDIMFGKKSDDS